MNGHLFKPRLLQSVLFPIFDVDGKKPNEKQEDGSQSCLWTHAKCYIDVFALKLLNSLERKLRNCVNFFLALKMSKYQKYYNILTHFQSLRLTYVQFVLIMMIQWEENSEHYTANNHFSLNIFPVECKRTHLELMLK